jgi:1-deoxy-D-xylulose-5-phosphate reductoisomerase
MKRLTILGSTGSIGVNTLNIVSAHPDRFQIKALTAGYNLKLLIEQINICHPELVAVVSPDDATQLRKMIGPKGPEIVSGVEGLIACATHPESDMVVSAIVGAAGLVPTMAAIEAGKDIALANKETLVTAGKLVMQAVEKQGVKLFPIDSEHSAIFQSLEGHRADDVRRLILTASGGPFLGHTLEALEHVTLADALNHPNWSMGRKISIDSATMMNKGLEVIEARWLFNLPSERIAVHIHPQSVVHSMVEYVDGSVMAQLGIPDMKGPIAYALSYPERLVLDLPPLDLCQMGSLTFAEPDHNLFPCLSLAYQALESGESFPAVLNAANEIAVGAFLSEQITFTSIVDIIRATLDQHQSTSLNHIDDVLHVDRWARDTAQKFLSQNLM